MNLAIKISLLSSGIFLLIGMLIGIVKHQQMLRSPKHTAAAYTDIAHRAAFLYSFTMLVVAKLLEFSPYTESVQLVAMAGVLAFLTITIVGYFAHGLMNKTDNLFRERTFSTTWYVYMLAAGEIGGLSIIIWGFVSTQILRSN